MCEHCGARFRFIDPTHRVIERDVRLHHCPICGRPVSPTESYKCTRCNEIDFCRSCIEEILGKYVCRDCIAKANEGCDFCGKYTYYKCGVCLKKTCRFHAYDHFLVLEREKERVYSLLMCQECGDVAVCRSCAKPKIFGRFSCNGCGNNLKVVKRIRR